MMFLGAYIDNFFREVSHVEEKRLFPWKFGKVRPWRPYHHALCLTDMVRGQAQAHEQDHEQGHEQE